MSGYFSSSVIDCAGRPLDLTRPRVMGILNVTPDSFSDGGRYTFLDTALKQAEKMLAEGADIIDVGGESTRPGASDVSENEELERVAPVVEKLVSELGALVSLDTSSPRVIREGATLGAGIINDVRSLTRAGALQAASETDMAVCVMHMKGEPKVMQQAPHYDEPVAQAVIRMLEERVAACIDGGIQRERLLIDPGFGFGKTVEHNLELAEQMAACQQIGLPLLVGVSRKSMIGAVLANADGTPRALGDNGEGRLAGGLALTALAIERGARVIRTHDVAPTRDVVEMTWAVINRNSQA
ncbi:dihydropteroate synthase [Carnimonas bestiolae]|uniref:dihydropteroate synthase n=1 Tax=Carnimonas bestiolae TaxID=3402172 RepID=UPI003EDB738C